MAEADWTTLTDGLDSGSVARGVTAGITPPNGGGSFVFGFNSKDVSIGACGLFCNLTNYAPAAKGMRITGCLQRGAGGGPSGFSPMLFVGLQGPSVNDVGYLLGLSDADPSHVVLRKGALSGGIKDTAPGGDGVLRKSTSTKAIGEWVHLRIDMIVNLNGDVRLQVFENDLEAHALGTSPTWTAIPGMAEFVDDTLGVNSGSTPYTSGRGGFAFRTSDVTRRSYVDHVEVYRQL